MWEVLEIITPADAEGYFFHAGYFWWVDYYCIARYNITIISVIYVQVTSFWSCFTEAMEVPIAQLHLSSLQLHTTWILLHWDHWSGQSARSRYMCSHVLWAWWEFHCWDHTGCRTWREPCLFQALRMVEANSNMFVWLQAEVMELEGLVQVQVGEQDRRGLRSHCQEIYWKQVDQQRALMKQWELVLPFDVAQQEICKWFWMDQIACCLGVNVVWLHCLGSSDRYCN